MTGAILVLAAVCSAFWLFWGYVSAFLSGWVEMGQRFRDRSPVFPKEKASASILIGADHNHRASVMIGVDDLGLHLRRGLVGRPGHPPLLFPWDTVDARGSFAYYWFSTYDAYGVGYYTTIAVPTRSTAAHLISGFLQSRRLEVRHP